MSSLLTPQLKQIFSTAMLINISQQFNYLSPEDASAYTNEAISSILNDTNCNTYTGPWKIVWGPYVITRGIYKKLPVELNAMYVAYNETENIYLVAIAGTYGMSFETWIGEDFNIAHTVTPDFIPNLPSNSNVAIAHGTYDAMNNLITMTDPATSETVLAFLTNALNANSTAQIYVCGHSLGGTLSPVMAIYLQNNLPDVHICCMPVASLTSGNLDFAMLYDNLFQDGKNFRIVNEKDFAPNCFEILTLVQQPWLYSPNIKSTDIWDAFIAFLGVLSLGNTYTQIAPYFSFNPDMFLPSDLPPSSAPDSEYTSYTQQVECQHVPAYGYTICDKNFLTNVSANFNALVNSNQFPNGLTEPIEGLFFTSGCNPPSGKWN